MRFWAAASSPGCTVVTSAGSGPKSVCSYASRDRDKAEQFRNRYGGQRSFASYGEAIADPSVDAVVVAVPPRFHLELTLRALEAGKHVLVEKPAFPRLADYETVLAAKTQARKVVLVGENDHYKPLAVCLRSTAACAGRLVRWCLVTSRRW